MAQLSYRRHRFPARSFSTRSGFNLRFTLSYRDVEELLAERGLDVSYETVRRWVLKFGPLIARKLRQGRPRPSARWHLDEMVVRIAGKRMYLCAPSTTRVKSSTCSFSVGAIRRRHFGLCASCLRNRASHRSCWLPTSWAPTA